MLSPLSVLADDAVDHVLFNGAVYTVDDQRSRASAVALRDGRIAYVGNDRDALALADASTTLTDLDGRMLLPGFHDSHTHPMAAGTRFLRCTLDDLDWPDEVMDQLAKCTASLAPDEWLRGIGLDPILLEGHGPGLAMLDAITGDRPALISPTLPYAVWVNSAALAAAGIHARSLDPEYGEVVRYPASREPTGVLRGEALGLVWGLASQYSPEQLQQALARATAMAHAVGITSASESSAGGAHWKAYREAERTGALKLKITASMVWGPESTEAGLPDLLRFLQQATGERFRAPFVKMFLDGGDATTAHLMLPRTDDHTARGLSQFEGVLDEWVTRFDAAGLDVHLHAWGDQAVRDALDAIETAMSANPARERRHQVAHLALIDPADLPRFAALGVTANVQPLWAWFNGERRAEAALLGPERSARLVPINSLVQAGAHIVAGSDWISESMNPLVAIQYAVTRQPLDGSAPPWNPDERATLAQMIDAYTINGAWLARQAAMTGSIEVGKAADLVVLERDLFAIDPLDIASTKVELTLLDGEVVYRR